MTTNESADTDDMQDLISDDESVDNDIDNNDSTIQLSVSNIEINGSEATNDTNSSCSSSSCAEKMFIDEDFVDCLSLFRDSSASSTLNSMNGASSCSKFQQLLSRTNSSCSNSIFGSGANLLGCSSLSSMSLSNLASQDEFMKYPKDNRKDNHWGSNLSLISAMDANESTSTQDQLTPFSASGHDFVDFISDFSISPRSPRSPRNLVTYDKAVV
jgi:hypothetical protein